MEKERKRRVSISYKDRKLIELMQEKGVSVAFMADYIGVHRATLYRELKRGGDPYRADKAQQQVGCKMKNGR